MPSDQSLIEPQSLVLSQVTSKRKREFSIFSSPEYVYLLHLVDQRSSFLRRNMGSIKSGIIVPDSSGQLWRSSQVSNSLLLILELALQTWMQPSIKKRPMNYYLIHKIKSNQIKSINIVRRPWLTIWAWRMESEAEDGSQARQSRRQRIKTSKAVELENSRKQHGNPVVTDPFVS